MAGDILEKVTHLLLEDDAFARELEEWCLDHCGGFDLDQADDEHSLAYTDLHGQFCLLFEKRIERFLDGEGYSTAEFWQKLTKAVDDDRPLEGEGRVLLSRAPPRRRGARRFMLEALKTTCDYEQFVAPRRPRFVRGDARCLVGRHDAPDEAGKRAGLTYYLTGLPQKWAQMAMSDAK